MKRVTIPHALKSNFCTYLVILLIPVTTLTFFFYTYLITQFQETIYQAEQKNCENAVMRIENRLNQLKDMAIQFGNNKDILPYNLEQSIPSRIRVIDMFQYSLSLSETIDDVLLLTADQTIYSSTGSYQTESYSEIFQIPLDQIYDTAMQYVNIGGFRLVYLDNGYAYFSCNYPYSSPYPAGLLIFKVPQGQLISNLDHESYAIYYDDYMVTTTDVERFPSKADQEISPHPNCKYFFAQAGAVSIITFIDQDQAFMNFYTLRSQIIILEIVTLLISLLLISYFSYKNYQPLKQLKNTLHQIGMDAHGDSGDVEIPDSIRSLELLFSQNRQLSEKIENEKFLTCQLLLSSLLEDRYNSIESLRKSLESYGVKLNCEEYVVTVLKCSREMELRDFFSMAGTFHADLLNIHFCYDISNRITVIIGGKRLTRSILEIACRTLIEHLNHYQVESEAYVGPVYNGINSINQSYVKALSLLDYHEIVNGVQHYYSVVQLENRKIYYPQTELNNLFNALLQKNYQVIDVLLQTIIQQVSNEVCDFPLSKTITYALVNIIIKSLTPDDLVAVKKVRDYMSRLERINCKLDVLELMGEVRMEMVSEHLSDCNVDDAEGRLNLIMQYINTHYDDPEFFIGTVAEKYKISSNNLSQQFKRKFGITPAKYLNTMRVEKAKQLLQTSTANMQTVAQLSGFADFSSFNRNFKLTVSITPSQYRSLNKKGE